MAQTLSSPVLKPTLAQALTADRLGPYARTVLLAFLGTVVLAVSARVQIPFWPVPMTMQTFAVLVIGMAYGRALGGLTVGLYLFEGALGLPVFAGGGGLAYLLGPTAGYLFGFLAAAVLVGWLAERGWDRSHPLTLAAMGLGMLVIYTLGVGWLGTLVGHGQAVQAGLVPFLGGDLLKMALAAVILPLTWRSLARR